MDEEGETRDGRKSMINPLFSRSVLMLISGAIRGENANDHFYLELAKAIQGLGGALHIYVIEEPSQRTIQMFQKCGAKLYWRKRKRTRFANGITLLWDAFRLTIKLKPALLVGQYSSSGNAVAMVGAIMRCPSIKVVRSTTTQSTTVSGKPYSKAARLRQGLFHWLATCTIAVSEAVRDDVIRVCHGNPRKVVVLKNSVRIDDYKPKASPTMTRRQLGVPRDAFVLLKAAVFQPVKGHDVLIEALATLNRTDIYLLLAGDGPTRAQMEDLAARRGLTERIRFLGRRKDVADLLAACDCAVLASLADPFPLFVLESMAAARPMIATSVDGIPEMIVDGTTGLMVPPRDASQLSIAIAHLADDIERSRAMGAAAQARAKQEFELATRVRNEIALYRKVLGATPLSHQ